MDTNLAGALTPRGILHELSAPFPADAISWRVGSTTKDKTKGLALAYIDARDVQDRLDAAVGPENWRDEYQEIAGFVVCKLWVRVNGEWIWKCDGAGKTDVEAEKGMLSDAFKRAAVKWGVGRYLYSLKSPWVALEARGNSYSIAESEYPRLEAILGRKLAPAAPEPRQAAPVASKPAPQAPIKEATSAPSLPQRGGNKEPGGSKPHHPADALPHSRLVHNEMVNKLGVYYAALAARNSALPSVKTRLSEWDAWAVSRWGKMNTFDTDRVKAKRADLLKLIEEKDGSSDRVPAPAPKTEDIIDPDTGELKEAAA